MADFDFTQLKGRMAQAGKGGHVELSDLERNALIDGTMRADASSAITTERLADKAYAPTDFSGLGRKYIEKNIVEVSGTNKNVLTSAMVSDANTIYHIQYDYDLNGQTITLPAGSTLSFEGGSLSNGNINGTNSLITGNPCIYADVSFGGTWANSETSSEWFAPSVTDFYILMNSLLSITKEGGTIHVYRNTTLPDTHSYVLIDKSYKIDYHNTILTLQERAEGIDSVKIVIRVLNDNKVLYGISISNLIVNATANLIDTSQFAGQTSFWGFIYASNVSDFTIDNIKLTHTHQGLKFGKITNDAEIRKNIYVRNSSIQGKMCCAFFSTENVSVENCSFDCSDAENSYDHAFYVTNTQGFSARGCSFSNALDAINLFNSGTVTREWDIENAVISNSKVYNCRRFIAISKGKNITIESTYIDSLQENDATINTFWCSGCRDIYIDGVSYKSNVLNNRHLIIQASNTNGGEVKVSNLNVECFVPNIAISGSTNFYMENCSLKLNGAAADYSNYAIFLDFGNTSSIHGEIKKCTFNMADCAKGQYIWIRNSSATINNSAEFTDCVFKRDNVGTSKLLFDQLSRLAPDIVVRNSGIQTSLKIKDESSPKYFDCYKTDDNTLYLDVPYYKYATKTNIDNVLTPLLTQNDVGYIVYDSTNSKMILWNGTTWVNMDGTALS